MPSAARVVAQAALLLTLTACGGSDGARPSGSPTMRPGEDCLSCHGSFTAAGTVYGAVAAAAGAGLAGATVTIDGSTASVTLTTNAAGNFYTAQAFGLPASVTVSYGGAAVHMAGAIATRAGCASCHGAALRVHVP
jgi:hypothetical protein